MDRPDPRLFFPNITPSTAMITSFIMYLAGTFVVVGFLLRVLEVF
ncbi:MAG: hypothetical protein ABIS50_16585 [Luteolibacter sp.]